MLSYTSYFRAKFSDPGFIPFSLKCPPEVSNLLPEKLEKYCNRCTHLKNPPWKPSRAHHCKICKKCVFRMDHHCDFIDNCVGVKNQKFFIQFLFYTMIYSFLVAFLLIICFSISFFYIDEILDYMSWENGFLILIFALSMYFTNYSYSFLNDQYVGLIQNQTTVESYRSLFGKPGELYENASQIFGNNKWSWIFPTTSNINSNYLEQLYSMQDILAFIRTKKQEGKQPIIPDIFKENFSYYLNNQAEFLLQNDENKLEPFVLFEEQHQQNPLFQQYKVI